MAQSPQRDEKNAGPQKTGGGSFDGGGARSGNGGPPSGGDGAKPAFKGVRPKFFDRSVTITLSVPKALFSVLFSLFILVWVFIFGIMLGRGHNPEEVVPKLAGVMPSPAPQSVEMPEADEILRRGDLQYHDSLKGKNADEKPRVSPPAPSVKPVQQQAVKPETPAKPKVKPQPPKAAPASAETAPNQDRTVYNYLYQVAAFNNSPAAETMRKKLENAGFSVTVSESEANQVTWHRILISFKGRPEDTRKMREKLAEFGIKNVILRGKSAAK